MARLFTGGNEERNHPAWVHGLVQGIETPTEVLPALQPTRQHGQCSWPKRAGRAGDVNCCQFISLMLLCSGLNEICQSFSGVGPHGQDKDLAPDLTSLLPQCQMLTRLMKE